MTQCLKCGGRLLKIFGEPKPICLSCPTKKNKYRAKRTEIDGLKFASTKEGNRYLALKNLERAGEIARLSTQKRYPLAVAGKEICVYVADFVYEDRGQTVVEDVKGWRSGKSPAYLLYAIKRNLFMALNPDVRFVES